MSDLTVEYKCPFQCSNGLWKNCRRYLAVDEGVQKYFDHDHSWGMECNMYLSNGMPLQEMRESLHEDKLQEYKDLHN